MKVSESSKRHKRTPRRTANPCQSRVLSAVANPGWHEPLQAAYLQKPRLALVSPSLGNHGFTPIGQPEEGRQPPFRGSGDLFYAFPGVIFRLSLCSLKD